MSKIYDLYLNLLHNPFLIKNYRDLKDQYERQGMLREAEAFGKLIAARFQNDNHSNPMSEPPSEHHTNP